MLSVIGSAAILVLAFALWLWGYTSTPQDGLIAVIGAGIAGGVLYDIAVSNGRYIVPTAATDGINLGSLYGAIVGFSVAIAILQPLLASKATIDASTSFDAFLIALGVKTGSEYASSARIELTKTSTYISYDVQALKATTQPITVSGNLLVADPQKPILGSRVVHVFFKQGSITATSRDCVTTGDANQFTCQLPNLDSGIWESWASWDGDDTHQSAESQHETFTVAT